MSVACCALAISAFVSAQQVTTEAASSVTQTHATLKAGFASGSTSNGFHFKYGELVPLTDFSSHVLSSTSDPVEFVMDGAKNFYWCEAKGWAENERGLATGQESVLAATFTLTIPTAIEFDWCTDSEEDKTSFVFLVDGADTQHSVSGLQDNPNKPEFRHVSYVLPAGEHTVMWKFMKKGDTNVGGDIGILRNIHITNTTPGKWITKTATSSEFTLSGLYPSQNYLYRAFSVVNGDSIFSGLKQFETESVSIGEVSVTDTTQATATITGKVNPGDAEVERGFIISSQDYREQLDAWGKALVASTEVPITIIDNHTWQKSDNYICSQYQNNYFTISFTLTKPTTITFDCKAKGMSAYGQACITFNVDGKSVNVIRAISISDYVETFYSITLQEGIHTLRWSDTSAFNTTHEVRISNFRIGTSKGINYNKTISIDQNDMQHVLTELRPNTMYSVKSYMRPTFESELENRWSESDMYSDAVIFKTRNVVADTIGVNNLMQGSAVIRGKVDGGDATIVAKGLQYKTADAVSWSYIATVGSDDALSATLKRLRPNTRYQYRSYIQAQDCDTVFSNTASFQTLAVEALKPSVGTCTQHTATINAQVIMGDAIIYTRGLQFRTGNGAWTDYEDGGEEETYTRKFDELTMNAPYEARTYIQPQGLDTIYSDVCLFKTKNVEAYADSVTDIYPRRVTLHGHVSVGDDVAKEKVIRIYNRKNNKLLTEVPITISDTVFSETVTGLQPDVEYYFTVGVKGNTGDMVYSKESVFYTPLPFSHLKCENITQTTASFTALAAELGETPEEIGYLISGGDKNEETKVLTYTEGMKSLDFKITDLYPGQNYSIAVYCKFDGINYYSNEIYINTKPVVFSVVYTDIKRTSATMNITMDNGDAKVDNLRYYLIDGTGQIPEDAVFIPAGEKNLLTGLTPATYYYLALRYEVNGKEYWRWLEDDARLITGDVNLNVTYSHVQQTTAVMKTIVDKGDAKVENMQYSINGGATWNEYQATVNLMGLQPNASYRPMFRWTVLGVEYTYTAPAFTTQPISIRTGMKEVCQTSALVSFDYTTGDATYIESGIQFNGERLQGETSCRLTELDPSTTYRYYAYVITEEGGIVYSPVQTFTTLPINAATLSATNVSNRSAQFNGKVQCDTYSSAEFGFEWKGMGSDWLADPVFTQGVRLDDGTMTLGLVSGMLEPNKDYQFRAVVKYKGHEYVGAWKNFHTELEYVFYAAQPVTLYRTDRETNSIIFCGYYIQGSEEIINRGYEYWQQNSQAKQMSNSGSTAVTRVETDKNMLYRLDSSGLTDGMYCVRAFVQTATSIYYGETLIFGIGENVDINKIKEKQPVCGGASGYIVFQNTEGLSCRVYNLSGTLIAEENNMQQTEHLPVLPGIYIVRFSTNQTIKVVVK